MPRTARSRGNRPGNTLLVQRLDPHAFGMSIVLYEHKVFVEAAIWDTNPFDQRGVELGKQLAAGVIDEIRSGKRVSSHDNSTNGLINLALVNLAPERRELLASRAGGTARPAATGEASATRPATVGVG